MGLESAEQAMRQLTGNSKESIEANYALFHGTTHADLVLENLLRTKLTASGKISQLRESVEATVRKGLTDSGTTSTVSATGFTDATKNWTANEWVGFTATVGTSTIVATSNTATAFTGTSWTGGQPASGAYTIGGRPLSESTEQELRSTGLTGLS